MAVEDLKERCYTHLGARCEMPRNERHCRGKQMLIEGSGIDCRLMEDIAKRAVSRLHLYG